MKIGPSTQQKRFLKTEARKSKNTQKTTPKFVQKQNIWGNESWRTFGGPNRFGDQKVGSRRCQSASKYEK
jgi:hypothetical protein